MGVIEGQLVRRSYATEREPRPPQENSRFGDGRLVMPIALCLRTMVVSEANSESIPPREGDERGTERPPPNYDWSQVLVECEHASKRKRQECLSIAFTSGLMAARSVPPLPSNGAGTKASRHLS